MLFAQDERINIEGKWGSQIDGTYINPVIPADFSDLDVINVGKGYYAISSTLQYSPGMVVLYSNDLVEWDIIGHVVDNLACISPALSWNKMNSYGQGIWAGAIRYHKGKFWVYFGTPDNGFFMSTAQNPAGPWEPPHQVWKTTGWDDCCPFWDDDGQGYFVATNFLADPKNNKRYNIHLFKMSADGRSLVHGSDSIIHQSDGSEANKLYKINGLYYHYFSEVKPEGRVAMMGRAKNLYGLWEIKQLNHAEGAVDPNQGGLVCRNGKWWFFTHNGTGTWAGRVANLLPVSWVGGWPIIGAIGKDSIGNMVWRRKKPIVGRVNAGLVYQEDFNHPHLGL